MATALPEFADATPELIRETVIPSGKPAVLRGLVSNWPAVTAARRGNAALRSYLGALANDQPVSCVIAPPEAGGRMHYDASLRGFNFTRAQMPLAEMLARLEQLEASDAPPALAAQGVPAEQAAPGFALENRLDWLPQSATPRLWIGNRVQVAIHSDPADNIACVIAGRRRFTLFAPEFLPDLAMGPFDPTPAGTPISMADPLKPDFDRYPRFRTAMEQALTAELGPGDAIFIPYHWYHHVQSLDSLSMLVNFWWNEAPGDGGSPWDAMLHAIMALRHLPPSQRQAWAAMFENYVFLAHGDPAAHLPPEAAGILAANTSADRQAMRRMLLRHLTGER
jgi:hypothetical protein